MSEENKVKRFEPFNFMLVSGMIAISFAVIYSLFKYYSNVVAGVIIPPAIFWYHWMVLGTAVVGLIFFSFAMVLFRTQLFVRFRTSFSVSFFIFLFYLLLLLTNFPVWRISPEITAEELGHYYYGYIAGYYSLFLLFGLVWQGLLLSKIFKRLSYIESFIFSVNPPNILNLKLLYRYMIFVVFLWGLILLFLKYAV